MNIINNLKYYFVLMSFAFNLMALGQELKSDTSSQLNYIESVGKKNSSILILLHGYRSQERDLYGLKELFPDSTHIICPRAPYTLSAPQYYWYSIEFRNDGNHKRNLSEAQSSIQKIVKLITSIKKQYPNRKIVLGGFSQGAILSMEIGMNFPNLINGIIHLSGAPLNQWSTPNPSHSNDYKKIKVFCSHGSKDKVLSLDKGQNCKEIYEKAKVELTYKEYKMGHQINKDCLEDLFEWWKENFK